MAFENGFQINRNTSALLGFGGSDLDIFNMTGSTPWLPPPPPGGFGPMVSSLFGQNINFTPYLIDPKQIATLVHDFFASYVSNDSSITASSLLHDTAYLGGKSLIDFMPQQTNIQCYGALFTSTARVEQINEWAANGNISELRALSTSERGLIDVFKLVELEQTNSLGFLFDQGFKPDNRREPSSGNTIVHVAAQDGKINVLKLVQLKGFGLNSVTNNQGLRPSHLALLSAQMSTLKYFDDVGVDYTIPLSKSDFRAFSGVPAGSTAMHFAVQSGSTELLDFLKSKRLDVNATNDVGDAPLHNLIKKKEHHESAIKLSNDVIIKVLSWLKANDADLNSIGEWGTIAHLIADCLSTKNPNPRDGEVSPYNVLKLRLERLGIDFSITNKRGETPDCRYNFYSQKKVDSAKHWSTIGGAGGTGML